MVFSSSATKNPATPNTRSRKRYGTFPHEKDEGTREVTMAHLNQLLLKYPPASRQTAYDIVGGFQDAIDDIEDINLDDMDEAYTVLYQSLTTMSTFRGIHSRLAGITLAKFFVHNYQYLPSPSMPFIQNCEANDSHPN